MPPTLVNGARKRSITASEETPRTASGFRFTVSQPRFMELQPFATPTFDAVRTSLQISAQGRYHYQFDFSESGNFQAHDGTITQVRQGAAPQSAHYKFDGPDQVTAGGNGVTFVWRRTA